MKRNEDLHDEFDLKNEFFKYLFFWKYFVASLLFFLLISFFYLRYTHSIYSTSAKVQVLDIKQNNLHMPSAEDLFSHSKINLENEIEVLTSSSIYLNVIKNLDLNTSITGVGDIMKTIRISHPFKFEFIKNTELTEPYSYDIELLDNGFTVSNLDKNYVFKGLSTVGFKHDLPFEILNIDKEKWVDDFYKINFTSSENILKYLRNTIKVNKIGKKSDIISITHNHDNPNYSKIIINELIDVFNKDGITDRQLIHKRTINFVNERYRLLAFELDSIESSKRSYKIINDLVDLESNSAFSLNESQEFQTNLFSNQNQIFIVSNLLDELSKLEIELLPANIGIDNIEINSLIEFYNEQVLKQRRLINSAGTKNPLLVQINNSLTDSKNNILFSLKNYLLQLKIINEKLVNKFAKIKNNVSNIPIQEQNLRSIERNQKIKESLYLFLLQKGEEAQVSFAVTEPGIKVVEYAISGSFPISPKPQIIYLASIIFGLLVPFAALYIIFLFDNKVHSREDLDKFSLNVLGEIPFFDMVDSEKVFSNPDDRSIISESFRMLMSNVRYLQKNDSKSNVILVTSSIKGEGKTLNALNLALSFSSVARKVLLIGCDLRNPQLHKYIGFDKNISGLVDSLVDNKTEWKKNIINPFESQSLDVLLSGPLPPNPLNLINNGNIDILLKDARKTYDYIVIDSAPTLLVADTKSLIKKSDVLIFLTRCNVTDNDVLAHIKKVSDESDTNVGVILNGVGAKNSYGYSYGYRYGYGYNYKYSYNYGYGYGYNEESS